MKKPHAEQRPQAAQVQAIHRLIEAGRFPEARDRLTALRRRHPAHKPLLGLAWELEEAAGDSAPATLAAWEWAQSAPGSEAAWSALDTSAGLHFPALRLLALLRLDRLAGLEPPVPAPLPTPYGPLEFSQSLDQDLGRLLLACSRLDEAAAHFAKVEHPSARNNLALVAFAQGRIDAALERVAAQCADTPDNLFSLERLLRLRLWTQGKEAMADLAEPLLLLAPKRFEDALAKVRGLILLGLYDAAEAAWLAGDGDTLLDYSRDARQLYAFPGAFLAWRSGRPDVALERLLMSEAIDDAFIDEVAMARLRQDEPDWLLGDLYEWWPQTWLETLRTLADPSDDGVARHLEGLGAHTDYLAKMAELGGGRSRILAIMLLKRRAMDGASDAIAALMELLALPCGPDRVRGELHAWLSDVGILPQGARIRLWTQGKAAEIKPMRLKLMTGQTAEEDLPEADAARYAEATQLLHKNQMDRALEILNTLLEKHPQHPRLLANTALIRLSLNQSLERIEPLVEQALTLAPDYLFARVARAHLQIRRGEPERALKEIEPFLMQEEIHISEWRALIQTQIAVAIAKGDTKSAARLQEMLRDTEAQAGETE